MHQETHSESGEERKVTFKVRWDEILVPLSIFVSAVFISASILYTGSGGGFSWGNSENAELSGDSPSAAPSGAPSPDNIKPVTKRDHILGDANAPVKIVEFSDTECPFCKRFHPTLQQIVKEYDGKVAWVYSHFPLDSLHSKARKEAEATECAAELGGNGKFWAYLDRLFAVTPSNDGLDPSQLPAIAAYVGLDQGAFSRCLESGKHVQRVADDLVDAGNSGGQGTPYSVVIAKNGKKFIVSGAYPYEAVKSTIEEALKEK